VVSMGLAYIGYDKSTSSVYILKKKSFMIYKIIIGCAEPAQYL